nr:iron-containing alcohol dehydrogenase family protein [Nocardioides sp. JQ2195]
MTTASPPAFSHATPAFRTFCGDRAMAALPRELQRTGRARVVLVHGASVGRDEPAIGRVRQAVGDRLVGAFTEVRAHSPVPTVEAASRYLAEVGADAVIAVGGGSAVVTARAASILLAERAPLRQLCTSRAADGSLHSPRLLEPKIPQWILPTTPTTAYAKAGSAVRDPETGERLALFDPKTRAQGVFLDPAMIATTPQPLFLSATLNAFSMAVEGLQAPLDDPLTDALALHALREIAVWGPRSVASPVDPEPRLRLMSAALLAGQASDHSGSGLAQALSHAVGPAFDVSNGIIESILLPHAMRFNAPACAPGLRKVAEALGRDPDEAPAEAATCAVTSVLGKLNAPVRLRDVGIAREDLDSIVDHALDDWSLSQAPRRPSRTELQELLRSAW